MSFFKYIESRFVASQIAINSRQATSATSGIAANAAFKAWMWIALQAMTVLNFFLVPLQYATVLLHIVPAPRSAGQQVEDAQAQERSKQELAAKVANDLKSMGQQPVFPQQGNT